MFSCETTQVSKKRERETKSPKENEKKIIHRDIERQRRQEMAGLCASLRDLLPLQYIKGKRSTTDHMGEAVNYIKHMDSNIKELRSRRDELKNLSSNVNNNGNDNVNAPNSVTVNCCWNGVEVLISCGMSNGNGIIPLSKVLMELRLYTQLIVLTCTSTKVNQRILYKIHSQVNTLEYINLYELQQRLANVIN